MKTTLKIIKKSILLIIVTLLAFYFQPVNAQTSFQDNLTGEEQGEFPSKWDLIQGSAEVASLNGKSIIYLANKSIISPLINSENYLSDSFTLEFDAFYDGARKINFHQYYEIRFWEGHSYITLQDNGGFINPLNVYVNGARMDGRVNGAKVKYDGYKESMKEHKNNVWQHIKVNFNNGAIKVFIDDILLVNIPKIEFNPSMISIGVFTHEYADFIRAIKNVSITGINNNNSNDNDTSDNSPTDSSTDNGTTNNNTNEQTVDYDYNLPTEDGNANQILQTDGNGTVSWVDDNPDNNTSNISLNEETVDYDYTLPITDGTPNQILQTDGNGNLSWADNNPVVDNTVIDDNTGTANNNNTGLEAINEGNGIGWRLIGRSCRICYGKIGINAVDLSYQHVYQLEEQLENIQQLWVWLLKLLDLFQQLWG